MYEMGTGFGRWAGFQKSQGQEGRGGGGAVAVEEDERGCGKRRARGRGGRCWLAQGRQTCVAAAADDCAHQYQSVSTSGQKVHRWHGTSGESGAEGHWGRARATEALRSLLRRPGSLHVGGRRVAARGKRSHLCRQRPLPRHHRRLCGSGEGTGSC
eukprot:750497-Hanusia_phi.AAC.2